MLLIFCQSAAGKVALFRRSLHLYFWQHGYRCIMIFHFQIILVHLDLILACFGCTSLFRWFISSVILQGMQAGQGRHQTGGPRCDAPEARIRRARIPCAAHLSGLRECWPLRLSRNCPPVGTKPGHFPKPFNLFNCELLASFGLLLLLHLYQRPSTWRRLNLYSGHLNRCPRVRSPWPPR